MDNPSPSLDHENAKEQAGRPPSSHDQEDEEGDEEDDRRGGEKHGAAGSSPVVIGLGLLLVLGDAHLLHHALHHLHIGLGEVLPLGGGGDTAARGPTGARVNLGSEDAGPEFFAGS